MSEIQEIDLTQDESVLQDDDDDAGVCVIGCGDERILVIGTLRILLTEEQEERIRFYYENT